MVFNARGFDPYIIITYDKTRIENEASVRFYARDLSVFLHDGYTPVLISLFKDCCWHELSKTSSGNFVHKQK